MSFQPAELSPRARAYFEQVFKPQYEKLQRAVEQTPLAILVWGPGASAGDLYQKRLQIRDELRRRGHAAFFSEELERMAPQSMSQKGIEFLQAADLIVVMQASYGSVAEVHDFAEQRVINFKMLIFIDEKARDGYSYRGALQELKTLYNKVHIEFVAAHTRLEPGECTILRWRVVGGLGVTLNGRSVNRTGEVQVCPKETATYELAVDTGDGLRRNTVTIVVTLRTTPVPTHTFTPTPTRTCTPTRTHTFTPTPDTHGPPAPTALSPSGGTSVSCSGTQPLTWSSVSDPAGILRYEWVLERSTAGTGGPYSVWDSGNTVALTVSPKILCGWWYRWRVRAVDKLGNVGSYSTYAYFSIGID